jgi:hypothetical protein
LKKTATSKKGTNLEHILALGDMAPSRTQRFPLHSGIPEQSYDAQVIRGPTVAAEISAILMKFDKENGRNGQTFPSA